MKKCEYFHKEAVEWVRLLLEVEFPNSISKVRRHKIVGSFHNFGDTDYLKKRATITR